MAGELKADSRKDFLSVRNEDTKMVGLVQGGICPSGRLNTYPVKLTCRPESRPGGGLGHISKLVYSAQALSLKRNRT